MSATAFRLIPTQRCFWPGSIAWGLWAVVLLYAGLLTSFAAPDSSESAQASSTVPVGKQLVVAVAIDSNTNNGVLRLFTRTEKGWRADSEPIDCLFGKNGMAWGRGLNPAEPGLQKQEKDGRTPTGRFRIGKALGQEDALPAGNQGWPYTRVTERDAWVDDPNLPHYNQHVKLKPGEEVPPWFEKQRMKPNDFAYHWLLVIEHNTSDIVAGAGSAIFFHIRRGETKPTAGCTTMARPNLERLLIWLRPEGKPELVQLPKAEYQRLWKSWNLPSPAAVWGGTRIETKPKSEAKETKDADAAPAKPKTKKAA
ncbi:MAG: L,D-transpeptidase [Candidatus Methylacidiphilales bacterium]|nr:L,D-transpeptidase family protein [Candidatus Methylacidiphilales bacterium]